MIPSALKQASQELSESQQATHLRITEILDQCPEAQTLPQPEVLHGLEQGPGVARVHKPGHWHDATPVPLPVPA